MQNFRAKIVFLSIGCSKRKKDLEKFNTSTISHSSAQLVLSEHHLTKSEKSGRGIMFQLTIRQSLRFWQL